MKNIEKFTSTASALAQWELLPPGKSPFDEWLMATAEPHTRRGELLWKARNLLAEIDRRYPLASFCHTERLALLQAVKAEEATATRRYELYPTPDAAHEGFLKVCRAFPNCEHCPYYAGRKSSGDWNCQLRWLYDEATTAEMCDARDAERGVAR